MLENDEPWLPPKLQQQQSLPTISSQVPEITILNTGDKILQTNKQQTRTPINNRFSPTVPDVSVINQSESNQNRIFTHSHKDMLINNHDQIMKQNRIQILNELNEDQFLRDNKHGYSTGSGLLAKSQMPYEFKPNPLCKYVPTKISKAPKSPCQKDGNTSSILIDSPKTPVPFQRYNNENDSINEGDEVQFKSVAGIISEIQRLVTPSKIDVDTDESSTNGILKKLAKMYLTNEEYLSYDIEEELR